MGLALIGVGGILVNPILDQRQVSALWASLEERSARADRAVKSGFSEEIIKGLSAPAQRYFRHSIQPGAPLATRAYLSA